MSNPFDGRAKPEDSWPIELKVMAEAAFGFSSEANALLRKLSLTELRTFADLLIHVHDLVDDEIGGRLLAQLKDR